jgi:hypothetical protein
MLKLKNIATAAAESVHFDFHVPVNIEFGTRYPGDEGTHCYVIKDTKHESIFEVAIGPKTGDLKYITLVASHRLHLQTPQADSTAANNVSGLPSFEIKESPQKTYYSDITIDFDTYINENKIFIILFSHKIHMKIKNDRVAFGFDKDNTLCSIEIKNLTTAEKALLEEIISKKGCL